MHCHHEKTIVIDDRVAFVGGIDLTSESGDRYDTNEHPPRARRRLARRVRAHRRPGGRRRRRALPHALARGDRRAARRRSRPSSRPATSSCRSSAPCPSTSTTPCRAATSASSSRTCARCAPRERFIYLENQFLWSPEIEAVLRRQARATRRSPTSGSCCVLPAKPNSGADDTRGVLGRADRRRRRRGPAARLHALRALGRLADPVYVHAKIAIVDDEWLTLGSANLNEHSLFNDTEMNIVPHDPALADETRLRLWAEHLELPIDEIPADPDRRRSTSSGSRSARSSSSGARTAGR